MKIAVKIEIINKTMVSKGAKIEIIIITNKREAVVKAGLSDGKINDTSSLQIGDFRNVKIADKPNEMRPNFEAAPPHQTPPHQTPPRSPPRNNNNN